MAKRLHLRVPHLVGQDEAYERMRALGDYFTHKYGVQVSWHGLVGRLEGRYMLVRFEGVVHVSKSAVDLDGKDPGMFLRNQAMKYLERKIKSYLDPSAPIELLPRS